MHLMFIFIIIMAFVVILAISAQLQGQHQFILMVKPTKVHWSQYLNYYE